MPPPPSQSQSQSQSQSPIRIGALAPLSKPGWAEAGRHLLTGIELAVGDSGIPIDLLIRDTAADPAKATAAVDELADLGAAAIVGEYHSVVARTAAARADARGIPFLCSSAVLDTLTEHPTDWVARIAPAQSHCWQVYADFLLAAGHTRIAVAAQPTVYWESGTRVLRDRLTSRGATLVEVDITEVCDALVDSRATALLLLAGTPEPAVPIVKAVRADARLTDILIGAPAGQPEFTEWAELLGADGTGIPFLSYLPEALTPLGERVDSALHERLAGPPSFVAFEGYDTIAVLAEILRTHGSDRKTIAEAWPHISVEGTRGHIRFSRAPGISVGIWQWAWPPVQVIDRDPADPARIRVRYSGPRS
ncbi:ABC transporter substrate-binding protein [Catenulispora sp. GP43]|uniref:ABC transporter substrate-binding protein n=1 Tax=Catenulispora sp. GP43 TaxID=3156263 RepID=UPI003519CA82